jgi:glyoxylase-like metal-dependent hydrolase (beta-lactamase superfamily II)
VQYVLRILDFKDIFGFDFKPDISKYTKEFCMLDSWKIGEITVTRILEMEMPLPYRADTAFMPKATPAAIKEIDWLFPHYVTPEGFIKLAFQIFLVQAPGLRLVVDTCIGNDKPRHMLGGKALQTSFLENLELAGWTRDSVDYVVCTHLHVDHVGWNTMKDGDSWVPTFPNARYLIGATEYEYWSKDTGEDQVAIMLDSIKPVFDAGLVDLVETDHVISADIKLIPTVGHTPGHVSVMLESQEENAMITGDFMHHPCQIAHPDWTVTFDEDPEAAANCRLTLLKELADSTTLVIGTHFSRPTAGKIVSVAGGFKFET